MTKLSKAQTEALTKMINRQNNGWKVVHAIANASTIKSLIAKGLITYDARTGITVTPAGYEAVGMTAPVTEPEVIEVEETPMAEFEPEFPLGTQVYDGRRGMVAHVFATPSQHFNSYRVRYEDNTIGFASETDLCKHSYHVIEAQPEVSDAPVLTDAQEVALEMVTTATPADYFNPTAIDKLIELGLAELYQGYHGNLAYKVQLICITDAGRDYLRQTDAGQDVSASELELTEAQIAVIDELMKRNPAKITRTRLIEMGLMRGNDCDDTMNGLINYGLVVECEVFGRNGYELTLECEDYCQGTQYQDHCLCLKIDELNRRITLMQNEVMSLIEKRAQLYA